MVDDVEQQMKGFKPKTYDLARQLKAIEGFEAQAVKTAQETKAAVDAELVDLEKALKNIEEARPFEELTDVCHPLLHLDGALLILKLQDEVVKAAPEIDRYVEKLVSNHRWNVPGYKVIRSFSRAKFDANQIYRRGLVTSRYSERRCCRGVVCIGYSCSGKGSSAGRSARFCHVKLILLGMHWERLIRMLRNSAMRPGLKTFDYSCSFEESGFEAFHCLLYLAGLADRAILLA